MDSVPAALRILASHLPRLNRRRPGRIVLGPTGPIVPIVPSRIGPTIDPIDPIGLTDPTDPMTGRTAPIHGIGRIARTARTVQTAPTIVPTGPSRRVDPIDPTIAPIAPTRRAVPAAARKSARLAPVFAFIALLAGVPAFAASDEALEHFDAARAAFDAGDYSKARALFEQALAAGMDGPAIHYNIGAAAYRGGDLPRAERAFHEVARTPSMAALAHYNLGLVALERRDEREARDWFQRSIYQDVPDERLHALASRRLSELPEPRAPGVWSYYSRGGAGYDDNVALRSSSLESSASGEQDEYAELLLAGSYSFGAWRLDAGGSMVEYASLNDFSQSAYYLGGARGFRTDKWYFELGAYGSQFTLGGEAYEQDVTAGLQVIRAFYGGSRLRAQLRATSVEGQGEFTGLTGERRELGLYYDKRWRAWNFGVHTRAEINDSEDPVFATEWFQVGAEARYVLSSLWGFSASAALRRTTHPPSATFGGWDDNRVSLHVGATRALWKQAQLFVRYEIERNDSPVVGYDYDRSRVCASVEFWY